MELQDRGSPHVHLVLWTGKSADELLAMPDLVVAQIPQHADDEELYDLVLARQRHTCTNYCHSPRTEGQNCRFGFPFEEQREAYLIVLRSELLTSVLLSMDGSILIVLIFEVVESEHGYSS